MNAAAPEKFYTDQEQAADLELHPASGDFISAASQLARPIWFGQREADMALGHRRDILNTPASPKYPEEKKAEDLADAELAIRDIVLNTPIYSNFEAWLKMSESRLSGKPSFLTRADVEPFLRMSDMWPHQHELPVDRQAWTMALGLKQGSTKEQIRERVRTIVATRAKTERELALQQTLTQLSAAQARLHIAQSHIASGKLQPPDLAVLNAMTTELLKRIVMIKAASGTRGPYRATHYFGMKAPMIVTLSAGGRWRAVK